jgi:hypothetical protein
MAWMMIQDASMMKRKIMITVSKAEFGDAPNDQ